MDSSLINLGLNLRLSGNVLSGDSSLKLNPTVVWKYSTSTVHRNVPEIKQVTANLLCRSLRIAEKNYAPFDKQETAVKTSIERHSMKELYRNNAIR